MIRNLFIIAVAALVLSIACLMGAAAIGGHEFRRGGWSIPGDAWTWVSSEDIDWSSDSVSERVIEWPGGDALAFHLPARVIYAQADETSVTVSGDPDYVERVRFEDGRFTLDRRDGEAVRGGRLRITVTAPAVTRFEMHGSHRLEIRDYDQDSLAIRLNGSGDVEAFGRARALDLEVHGSGDAELDGLSVQDARIAVHGSGSAEIAATGQVDAAVHGSGDIELKVRPAQLNSQVHGSGRVRQDD